MRSFQATHNLLAVSANSKETALNTAQTLNVGMLVDLASMFKFEARRETNGDEAIGKEEPDAIYDLGALGSLDLSFTKMQAQHAAFIMAFALGAVSTAGAGSTGYKHTITPISGDLDTARSNPTFTAGMRYGKWLLKELYAGCMIDTFTLSLKKDSWASIKAAVKSTGNKATTVFQEDVAGFMDSTTFTLAAKGIAGSTAQERLDNVHQVKVLTPVTLQYADIVVTAVSGASPAVFTITSPGGAHTACTFRVLYNQAETGGYAWGSFPARISEPPMRVSDFSVILGGKWDGSAILGGHTLQAEFKGLEWTFNNGLKPEFVPGGGTYSYANRALRDGRSQKVSLDRDFRDYLIGQRLDDVTTFVLYAKAEGPEYESGHKYTIEIIFPLCGVLSADRMLDGRRLGEKGDIAIFEDDTYGSVIVNVKNKVAAYAA